MSIGHIPFLTVRIDTIVVSTQHDEFIQPENDSKEAQLKADEEMLAQIRKDVIEILMPRVIAEPYNKYMNFKKPTTL